MNTIPRPGRLLLAIGNYAGNRGGASEWLQDYARWLVARGYRVAIVCGRAEAPPPPGCDLLALPPAQSGLDSFARARALQGLLPSARAEIVHDTGCLLAADVFHPLMGSLIHNWLRQLHALPPAQRPRRFWQGRVWRDARMAWHQRRHYQRLVACSRLVAADFRHLGCPSATVIPNGIRLSPAPLPGVTRQLRRELRAEGRLLILVTATNYHLKGVMTVVRALARLSPAEREQFRVVFTGLHYERGFQRQLDRRGLQDTCLFAGWVDDIENYYPAADIFLHPTFHDAGSLSTLKALAAGCAVVTSRFDGSAEQIEPGVDGLVLQQPASASELAQQLRRLLDAEFRHRLRAAARALAPRFNQERQFQQLEALYPGVMAAKKFPP